MNDVKISANHDYTVNGKPMPSVSNILDVYFPPTAFYTEAGREDGHSRHNWYAHLAQGVVPVEDSYSKIDPAIKGFIQFLDDVKPEYVIGEKCLFHPALNYCGTPDVVFKINSRLCVVDYKPKAKKKRTKVQTALYYLMLRSNGLMVDYRYELRCYDGIYRFEKHEDLQDIRRAEIMVAAYHASQFYK